MVAAANPLARIFIIPHPGAKQQTLNHLKEFNWATRKKIAKLCKKDFTVEYINVHKLFLNDDGSFMAIIHWYVPDNYHVSNYVVYFIHKQFWRPVALSLKSSKDGELFLLLFLVILFIVTFDMMLTDPALCVPMTCIAGMSFISHILHCRNQLSPKKHPKGVD